MLCQDHNFVVENMQGKLGLNQYGYPGTLRWREKQWKIGEKVLVQEAVNQIPKSAKHLHGMKAKADLIWSLVYYSG